MEGICENTFVLTKSGYQLIDSLKPNDLLLTHDNKYIPIKSIKCFEFNYSMLGEVRKINSKTMGNLPFESLYISKSTYLLFEDVENITNEYFKECYGNVDKYKKLMAVYCKYCDIPIHYELKDNTKFYQIILNSNVSYGIYVNGVLIDSR